MDSLTSGATWLRFLERRKNRDCSGGAAFTFAEMSIFQHLQSSRDLEDHPNLAMSLARIFAASFMSVSEQYSLSAWYTDILPKPIS